MRKRAQLQQLLHALSEHLRVHRKRLQLTQEQLAEVSGVSTNYVARLEIAANTPSLGTLVKLSAALKIGVSELLVMEHEPVAPSDMGTSLTTLLEPLNESELDYVLSQLRGTVRFVLSHRKIREDRHND